jgi:hypothetical protein
MPDEPLLELQRQFLGELFHPLWGESRGKTALPGEGTMPPTSFPATATRLLTPSRTLVPEARLELYHRQYWFRLLDSLEEDFPALRWLLGEGPFWKLLEDYLVEKPPTTPSLRYLGEGLADHIARHAGEVPHAPHAEDLARVEYALCLAMELGDRPTVDPAKLATDRLELPPHLQLIPVRTPAEILHARALRGGPCHHLAAPKPGANRIVAVYRHQDEAHLRRVPLPEHALLSAIARTHSLEAAMDHVLSLPLALRPKSQQKIQAWFRRWFELGWICS